MICLSVFLKKFGRCWAWESGCAYADTSLIGAPSAVMSAAIPRPLGRVRTVSRILFTAWEKSSLGWSSTASLGMTMAVPPLLPLLRGAMRSRRSRSWAYFTAAVAASGFRLCSCMKTACIVFTRWAPCMVLRVRSSFRTSLRPLKFLDIYFGPGWDSMPSSVRSRVHSSSSLTCGFATVGASCRRLGDMRCLCARSTRTRWSTGRSRVGGRRPVPRRLTRRGRPGLCACSCAPGTPPVRGRFARGVRPGRTGRVPRGCTSSSRRDRYCRGAC